MGFKDLQIFNQALLAKQAWRIQKFPQSLLARVLWAKYYRISTFLQAGCGNSPSYIWRSILYCRELLNKGIQWRIGDGTSVRVFHDPWLPSPGL